MTTALFPLGTGQTEVIVSVTQAGQPGEGRDDLLAKLSNGLGGSRSTASELLVLAAGKLWETTGGEDPHDALSSIQRRALDLAAARQAQPHRYPRGQVDTLIRSAGELWYTAYVQHGALSAVQHEVLNLASAIYRAELDSEMDIGE